MAVSVLTQMKCRIMKKQLTRIASWMLLATMGQAGASAQDIRIDMNQTYPEKTISLQEVAKVKYIPLETTDEALFDGTLVNLSSQGIPMSKVLQCAGDANQCYLLLEAFKLKEALAEGKLKGELKAVAEKLDEEDNPVVMIVEFNK